VPATILTPIFHARAVISRPVGSIALPRICKMGLSYSPSGSDISTSAGDCGVEVNTLFFHQSQRIVTEVVPCSMECTPARTAAAAPSLPCACATTHNPVLLASSTIAANSSSLKIRMRGSVSGVPARSVAITLIRFTPRLTISRDHPPDSFRPVDSTHQIGVLRKINEIIVRGMRPNVISGRDNVRDVHSTLMIQLAHADVRKVIDSGFADRRRPGTQRSPGVRQISDVHVRVHESRKQPVTREIDDGATIGRSRTVSNALNLPVHHGDGRIHRRRIGNAIDHIRMDEKQRIVGWRLGARRNCGDGTNVIPKPRNAIEAKIFSSLSSPLFHVPMAHASASGCWLLRGHSRFHKHPQAEARATGTLFQLRPARRFGRSVLMEISKIFVGHAFRHDKKAELSSGVLTLEDLFRRHRRHGRVRSNFPTAHFPSQKPIARDAACSRSFHSRPLFF